MTSMSKKLGTLALIGLVPTVGLACGDVLSLDVVAPGRLTEDALNTAQAVPGLVAGMSFDLSQSIDGALQDINVADGDTGHGGSYDLGTYPRGILFATPEDWDGEFGSFQQARWVAEDGLRRIATILEPANFESNAFDEFRMRRPISGRGEIADLDFFPNRHFFRLGTAAETET